MPIPFSMTDVDFRPTAPHEAEAVRALHLASIRGLCAAHYSREQIEQWASPQPLEIYERMIQEMLMVAVHNGALVGMAQMNSDTGVIQALYVHPDYARKRLGSSLLLYLTSMAYSAKLPRVTVFALLNAVEFFRFHDFTEAGPDFITLSDGTKLPCVRMEHICFRVLEFTPDQTIPQRILATLACDDRVRLLNTMRALREQAPQEVLDELIPLLRQPDQKLRRRAGVALGTFSKLKGGEITVEHKARELADYLADGPDEVVRLSCAIHLMPVGGEIVDRAFVQALQDSHDQIVELACAEVGYRGGAAGMKALFGLLNHPLWRIRLSAGIALINQKTADARVVATLEAMSRDPEAAAYDAEMAESREFRQDMVKAFSPEGESGAGWETFAEILARAREVARDKESNPGNQ